MNEIRTHLSTLHNNRASCLEHICDYKACIVDCDAGLVHLNQISSSTQQPSSSSSTSDLLRLKLQFKKAHSLEMSEKYTQAFVEYESLMRVDSQFRNVQANYNRVRKILVESGKIKLEKPSVELPKNTRKKPTNNCTTRLKRTETSA